MTYFLDTDICVFILRGRFSCEEKLAKLPPRDVKMPSMVQAELMTGVRASRDPLRSAQELETFLAPYETVPFDGLAAGAYAEIRSILAKSGQIIGTADLVIAATALAHHGTLVTHNTREFSRIPGLQIVDWTR